MAGRKYCRNTVPGRQGRGKKYPAAVCHPWGYALAANVASFGVGLILARLIPGMF